MPFDIFGGTGTCSNEKTSLEYDPVIDAVCLVKAFETNRK